MKQYLNLLWELNISSDIKYRTFKFYPEQKNGELKSTHLTNVLIKHDLENGFPNFDYLNLPLKNVNSRLERKLKREKEEIIDLINLLQNNQNYYYLPNLNTSKGWSVSLVSNRLHLSFYKPAINFFSGFPKIFLLYSSYPAFIKSGVKYFNSKVSI